jgi:hypothetical protein
VEPQHPWYAVRCIIQLDNGDVDMHVYEERITLWRCGSEDEAIARAEAESGEYAQTTGANHYLGLAQAYLLSDEPGNGAELFSLIRDSPLPPSAYLDRFFDTGAERQRRS